jgi:hypothetical protein
MTTPNQFERRILTLEAFGQRHTSFPPSVIRNLLWKAKDRYSSQGTIKGNGLDVAIVRIGKRVYIDEAKFFQWLDGQQTK